MFDYVNIQPEFSEDITKDIKSLWEYVSYKPIYSQELDCVSYLKDKFKNILEHYGYDIQYNLLVTLDGRVRITAMREEDFVTLNKLFENIKKG